MERNIPASNRWLTLSLPMILYLALAATPVAPAGPRSVVDLQTARTETSIAIRAGDYRAATLVNINPNIGMWYLLHLQKADGVRETLHLENPLPETQRFELDAKSPGGIVLVDDNGSTPCTLWAPGAELSLSDATKAGRPYVSLCSGRLFLRKAVAGRRTQKEWVADFLRDRVRFGDQITNFIKERLFRDRYLRKGTEKPRRSSTESGPTGAPEEILTTPEAKRISVSTGDFNIVVRREPDGGVRPGRWYAVDHYPGIFVAVMKPALVAPEVIERQKGQVRDLEKIESTALTFLVAFDLSQFDLGFALGTEHPRVGWSDRVPEERRSAVLPGPDGFDSIAPFQRTGMLNPIDVARVGATFSGGFKRTHGAFKWGPFAETNFGSHYGFVVAGTVLSTLQPGLATLTVGADGRVDIRTWTVEDARTVSQLRHARQNGVPILETDFASGEVRVGPLVRDWGKGNWSGSLEGEQRTLRAGVCVQDGGRRRFLIYGYFTSTTPSAMAQVFGACQCSDAMHLDMNAPEHTYLALYRTEGSQFIVQRLVREMAEVDAMVDGQELPRYVSYPDNRDYFFLLRKEGEP